VITSATYGQGASIGDFIDFLTPQFLLYGLPPKDVWTQTFDASTSAGLGSHARGDVYAEGLRAFITLSGGKKWIRCAGSTWHPAVANARSYSSIAV